MSQAELTPAEEGIMKHLWKLRRAYMKELLDDLPEPRPAKTTVATLLRRMVDKDLVGYETHGNSRQYFPKISKEAYFGRRIRGMVNQFFGGSSFEFASFLTGQAELSREELEELQRMIKDQIAETK
ncbi:putative transcriptional regulator [Neolewinella xylanilytica]|uniref:Putative transcriptional regulator n=1 Tax=Neolewinella xylanilytica TaxID=1514080 RepID=A0A2S6I5R0_9BACT|nr:BlaI/MecI/CopY family transcriptional regulator [Neolewinella xylanilytica]PPK86431.1 putative transcriptional regulator [Neolewinella xylanilytica]